MSGRWHAALAYAVSGRELDLGVQEAPDVPALAAELRARGVPVDAVRRPVPEPLRAGLGFAQLAAAEAALRERLGVTGQVAARPSGRARLDADERRLVADRPPHWG